MESSRGFKIAVSGSSGLIGSALVDALAGHGHDVLRLVRRPEAAEGEVSWDPSAHELDPAALAGVDTVVHLAGAGIGDKRWTPAYKAKILASRVDSTQTLSQALAAAPEADRPRALLSMSATGYYGDTGERVVDETDGPGTGFLAEVTRAWEDATAPAEAAGVRVVVLRTGPVLSAAAGFLGRMLPLARLALLSPLGSGRQYVPWISLADHVAAMEFLLTADAVSGPVNLTGPDPVPIAELTDTLLRVLGRPRLAPRVPAVALRLALGDFADEGVLTGQRAVPRVLEAAGHEFAHPTVESALRWATDRPA
ncbi:MAG: TIGR01777 family oxidoreductase [Actinomycetota bacterium]|nr:TIGR01777 family oxidoreductase [Actinomycetota bacterium]